MPRARDMMFADRARHAERTESDGSEGAQR